ncbi:MAG: prepilin-type N-terminal cleavage/methylation domain-containing protein [Deltaproteobacteria bacterium]|jgi:type IV pilus assembly protein PilV|nr:prepilin-type N-terminal cleavage/methylation domain-containing protein [Deltaproteobacteria bacterium]MBW2482459.1 prepilin-type N-terminal cleavage/methylation domain-containing protein [Deltaproteobacteria bacterium]
MKNSANRHFYFKDKNGMTIVEVLIAISIFAIGFLAIGTLLIWTTRNTTTSNIVTEATMMARERIEFLKTLPVEDMASQCLDEDEPEIIAPIYRRECEIEKHTDSANLIEVKVSWNRMGQNRDVVLRTLSQGNGS